MNEENKSQDDGYQEIDISNPQSQQQTEAPAKQEPEYVVEGLSGLEEKKPEPEPEVEIETTDVEATKELDGIETEGARKRINRLVKQRKEKEEKLLLAEQQIQQLQEQLNSQDKKLKDTEIASLTNQEKSLQQQLKNSEEAYKSAYDSGDKDKMLEAQKAIADVTTKLQFVDAKRWYQEDQQNKQKQEEPQQPVQQRVKPNSLAIEWKEDNETWFQKDPIMTQGALVINEQLLQEGFDPNTKEFYNEVSRRIKKEFPHKFGEQDDPTKPAQVVAGKSRTSASSKGKIRLSQEDVRLAKKMGVPLDVYAREKAKVEKAGDDYTTVNV
tara:strand:- start:1136 stop:2113 length:978 start_codon:yes stop_codon:yes gene_type:complete